MHDDEVTDAEVPSAPDTVTEALRILEADGYTHSFMVRDAVVRCTACGVDHESTSAIVERIYRFEGTSDPDYEDIVFGLRCPVCDLRGTLVSAFGPNADPEELDALRILGDVSPPTP
jgi:hypothetical protein